VAGQVALEQSGGLAATLAFGGASGDVVLGLPVVLTMVKDDRVQSPVELPRLSRCLVMWPLEAGTGATPESRAKAPWSAAGRDVTRRR